MWQRNKYIWKYNKYEGEWDLGDWVYPFLIILFTLGSCLAHS